MTAIHCRFTQVLVPDSPPSSFGRSEGLQTFKDARQAGIALDTNQMQEFGFGSDARVWISFRCTSSEWTGITVPQCSPSRRLHSVDGCMHHLILSCDLGLGIGVGQW